MEKELLEKYIQHNLSIRSIAAREKVSYTTIRYWLLKYGIKTNHEPFKEKIGIYKCSCGETDPDKFYGHKRTICSLCQNAYNKKKARTNKAFARKLVGDKCIKCGYDKCIAALDIHHTNPSIKDIHFRSMSHWSRERIIEEMKGCVLLCRNCHTEEHYPHLIKNEV